jgi:ribosomal protein S8
MSVFHVQVAIRQLELQTKQVIVRNATHIASKHMNLFVQDATKNILHTIKNKNFVETVKMVQKRQFASDVRMSLMLSLASDKIIAKIANQSI